MGSMTVNPVSPLITGASLTKTDTGGSTSSIVVSPTTAQSALRCDALAIVFENYSTTASMVISLGAGDDYSEKGQGAASSITLATNSSVIVGGRALESARYQTSSGTLVFTITTAATAYVYAAMVPFVQLNP